MISLERYDEIESTNGAARRRAEAGELDGPVAMVAVRQSGGYGRYGRRWHAPEGGLWWTLAWPLDAGQERTMSGLGLRVGAACLDVVTRTLAPMGVSPDRIRLKWPNDILIDGAKVSGCLVETVVETRLTRRRWLIVGVGVNVNNDPAALPGDLRRPATSLAAIAGAEVEIEALRERLTTLVIRAIGADSEAEVLTLWRGVALRLHRLDEPVTLRLADQPRLTGILRGLSDAGRLALEVDGRRVEAPDSAELEDHPAQPPPR